MPALACREKTETGPITEKQKGGIMGKEDRYFIRDNALGPGWKNRMKHFLFPVKAALYKILMNGIRTEIQDKPYNVSVCAIFKTGVRDT